MPTKLNKFYAFQVSSIGADLTAGLPALGRWGEVIAVFKRSCYVQAVNGKLICMADSKLGKGPLVMAFEFPREYRLDCFGVYEGTAMVKYARHIRLGHSLLLRTSGAEVWRPPFLIGRVNNAKIRSRIKTLVQGLESYLPSDGLATLLPHVLTLAQGKRPFLPSRCLVAQSAMPRVAQLIDATVEGDKSVMDDAVRGLIGLGPGLTPSGDDLLGGLMVALISTAGCDILGANSVGYAVGIRHPAMIRELANCIANNAAQGTNRISAAMLESAVLGFGNDAQHRLLNSLVQPEYEYSRIEVALRLAQIGHTSGWDSLVGLLIGVCLGLRLQGIVDGGPYPVATVRPIR